MPKFFIDVPPTGDTIPLTGDTARHITRVLRMHAGEAITLCDGIGTDYDCVLTHVGPDAACARITDTRPSDSEPSVQITLYMALPKADKMELIVQKSTELGVTTIVPFLSSRCVSRPDARALEKKQARWGKIAAEAAKQCGRGRIPQVLPAMAIEKAVCHAAQSSLALLLYEAEQERGLRACLGEGIPDTVSLMVGPEGGFAPEEVRLATAAGLQSVSLGKRILRCETAPIAALSAILYESGNL